MRTLPAASLLCCLLLCAPALAAPAEERWLHLGDTAATPNWPRGKVSIDLDSLRQRGLRHEIWERTVYTPETAQQWTWRPGDGPPERRTLWSVRCARSAMAVVTRGLAGAFEPRPERLQYYVPASGSIDAAVLRATCDRIRKNLSSSVAGPAVPLPEDTRAAWRILERPPEMFVDDD